MCSNMGRIFRLNLNYLTDDVYIKRVLADYGISTSSNFWEIILEKSA